MAKTVNINLKGLTQLKKDMPKLLLKVGKLVADEAPSNIVRNIERQKTGIFPSGLLPDNEPSTIASKESRGNGDKPLIDNGILTNESKWDIKRQGKNYAIRPPKERQEAVFNLQKGIRSKRGLKQYVIMVIPKGFYPGWAANIAKTFFNKIIPRYS